MHLTDERGQAGQMVASPVLAGRRLDGWKAIAGYFKRDRSTVMRWARERDLPVRRVPGPKQGSVFAYEIELAAWTLQHDDLPADPPAPVPVSASAQPRRHTLLVAAVLVVAVASALLLVVLRPSPPAHSLSAMPANPAAAADYVKARDLWARRTAHDVTAAIRLLRQVIARDPGFAPAHAALADAWLILREYGDVDDPTAFAQGRRAAERALRLDPDLPAAARALGFIDYWWSNDTDAAIAHFERAASLDPGDAQTHFWYANVLADLGNDARAQREYAVAQLLSPGSRAIEIEHAYSQWLAHRDALALAQLRDLTKRYPTDPNLHLCLSWVLIARGDVRGFAQENALAARYRNEPRLLGYAAELSRAAARDPAAVLPVLIDQYRRELARGGRNMRETPAFMASSLGGRTEMVTLMREADALGERWYSRSITERMAARWAGDVEVQRLLARLRASHAQQGRI